METAPSSGAPPPPGSYADSVDSLSPRSRGGESWDEPFPPPAAVASSKLRLMCSYGGHIVPRPHDKALCYLGGETRIVAVDRHCSLADLHARLSRSLLGGRSFSLKYQLPSEDLDSLISVSTDEDLDNMIDEYDRIAASAGGGGAGAGSGGGKSSRLRLFLFPAKPESPGMSSSSIGSLLDDSSKSETWFVDALNGATLRRNDSSADSAASSVNYLLGLEDSYPSAAAGGGGGGMPPESDAGLLFPRPDSSGKLGGTGRQDVQSMPDSPMLETTSSFGSASSVPSLSSLPPIRVRAEDPRGIDAAGLEEQLVQMNVSGQQQQQQQPPLDVESVKPPLHHFPPPPMHATNLIPVDATAATVTGETPTSLSPTENPKHSMGLIPSDGDDRSHQGGIRIPPPQLSQPQQQQPPQEEPPQEQQNLLETANILNVPFSGDAVSRPLQGYLLHQPSPPLVPTRAVEPLQQPQPQPQQQTRQPQQAIPQLASHHHAAGPVLPIASYYNQMLLHPQQQLPQVSAHPYSPQVPMYFLPIHPGSAYNLHVQPHLGDAVAATPISSSSKSTIPPPNSVLPPQVASSYKQEPSTNVYRMGIGASPALSQPPLPTKLIHLDQSHQYVGYQPLHHPTSQSAAATQAAAGYRYEFADAAHGYQVYYTPAPSAAFPQYQMMSAGAVTTNPPVALQQPTDVKETSAS